MVLAAVSTGSPHGVGRGTDSPVRLNATTVSFTRTARNPYPERFFTSGGSSPGPAISKGTRKIAS